MTVKTMSNQNKDSIYTKNIILSEMITGSVLYGVLAQVVLVPVTIFWLPNSIIYYSLGLWVGIIISVCLAIHMNYSISKALDFPEGDAVKIVRKDYIIRYLVLLVIFGILMVTGVVSPIVAFIGVMGLKIGAYIQPLTHNFLRKAGPKDIKDFIANDDIRRQEQLKEYEEEQKKLEQEKLENSANSKQQDAINN